MRLVGKKSSPERLHKIISEYAKMPVIAHVCRACDISRTSIKYYLQKSEEGDVGDGFDITVDREDDNTPITIRFHEAWAISEREGTDALKKAAYGIAIGQKEVLTYRGRVQYLVDPAAMALGLLPCDRGYYIEDEHGNPVPETIIKQDPDMIRYLLTKLDPETFGDKSQVDVRHSGGVLVVTDAKPVRPAEFEQLFGGKQEIQDVEFEEIAPEDDLPDPAA